MDAEILAQEIHAEGPQEPEDVLPPPPTAEEAREAIQAALAEIEGHLKGIEGLLREGHRLSSTELDLMRALCQEAPAVVRADTLARREREAKRYSWRDPNPLSLEGR